MTALRPARGRIARCAAGIDGLITGRRHSLWIGVRCDDPTRPWQSWHPTNIRRAVILPERRKR